ncbi:hypothetical protein GCM10009830_24640 [Glycomyces endophyticus]|uniref:Uncharacterized protein n=1 Tax=Glycomyces endophyticus TaxID=480996 RepID=A0ABP4SR22_9ACTN
MDQARRGDLEQVVPGDAFVRVAGGDVLGQRQLTGDQLRADHRMLGIVGVEPGYLGEQRREVPVGVAVATA